MRLLRRRSRLHAAVPRDAYELIEVLEASARAPADRAWDLGAPVRHEALLSLAEIGHPEVSRLAWQALNDPDVRVRLTAVDVLCRLEGRDACRAIVERATRWAEPAARLEAFDAVTRVDAPGAISALAAALVRHPEVPDHRLLRSLIERDETGSAGTLAARAVLAEVRDQHGRDDVAAAAQTVLVSIGRPALGPLMGALGSQATRPMAATILGMLREADAVPALVTILNASDPVGRPEAARALGEIRDPRAVETLLVASGDPEYAVRDAAGSALDTIGTVATVLGVAAAVRQALSSDDSTELDRLTVGDGASAPEPS